MTLDEIRNSEKDVLTPAEIAPVLGVGAQSIRAADPGELGFPVAKVGTRTLIPRKPFLAFIEGYAPQPALAGDPRAPVIEEE